MFPYLNHLSSTVLNLPPHSLTLVNSPKPCKSWTRKQRLPTPLHLVLSKNSFNVSPKVSANHSRPSHQLRSRNSKLLTSTRKFSVLLNALGPVSLASNLTISANYWTLTLLIPSPSFLTNLFNTTFPLGFELIFQLLLQLSLKKMMAVSDQL